MVVSYTKHSRNPIFCLGLCTIRLSLGYKSTNQITPYHRDTRGEIVAQIFWEWLRFDISWLVVWNMNFIFSIYWDCHHPNWRTHIFQRGWSTTNQSLTSHWPNMTSFVGPLVPISGRGIVMICLEMGFPKIQRFIILPSTCHFVSIQHLQIQIQHWCVRYA